MKLRSEIAWLLVVKAVALTIIWYLFFSPSHRMHVDGEVTRERFGLTPTEKTHD